MIFYVIFESKNFTNGNNHFIQLLTACKPYLCIHFIHVLITEYIFVALPASQYDNILETNIPSIHSCMVMHKPMTTLASACKNAFFHSNAAKVKFIYIIYGCVRMNIPHQCGNA